ncbi:MAG: hypothetical protein ACP5E4_01685 [Candidatus Aenigmatarchaeota archaeon]
MLLQLMGAVDMLVAAALFLKFHNPVILLLVLLLFLKGLSSFVPVLPPTGYIIYFCVFADLVTAVLIPVAYGFGNGIMLAFFFYFLVKGLWTLLFGLIFN